MDPHMDPDLDPYMDPMWIPMRIQYGSIHGSLYGSCMDPYMDPIWIPIWILYRSGVNSDLMSATIRDIANNPRSRVQKRKSCKTRSGENSDHDTVSSLTPAGLDIMFAPVGHIAKDLDQGP